MNLENIKRIRKDICGGCSTYEFGIKFSSPCKIPHKKAGHPCPCSMCIIKMVCEDECDELIWYKQFNTKGIKKKKKPKKNIVVSGDTHIGDGSTLNRWQQHLQFLERMRK